MVEKPEDKQLQSDGTYIAYISIPNSEISSVYKKEIMDYLIDRGALDISTADIISESLYANDNTSLQKDIKEYIFKNISFYDKNIEGFHHGLVLGLVAIMDNRYKFVAKTHRLAYGIKATFFDLNLTYIRYIIYV